MGVEVPISEKIPIWILGLGTASDMLSAMRANGSERVAVGLSKLSWLSDAKKLVVKADVWSRQGSRTCYLEVVRR